MKKRSISTDELIEYGAEYEAKGIYVAPDWRYYLIYHYFIASPSYQAVERDLLGQKSPYPLPKDYKLVAKVIQDFGPLYKMREVSWWRETGMYLYGIKAPAPQARLVGLLNGDQAKLVVNKSTYDSIVIDFPLNMTVSDAVKQFKKIANGFDFVKTTPKILKPKYQLEKIKLREKNLKLGLDALHLYTKKMPLWQIGNTLNLVPSKTFDESLLSSKNAYKYSENKEVMSIAASRLIRNAALVAENAARGRFPNNRPFKEAILTPYERDAGRPTGSTAPKRRKALD
jgi:hypothetical protein